MPKNIHTPSVDNLFKSILKLKNIDECYKFFSDVCTSKEILAISQRFEVAGMLLEGNTYQDIVTKTGASTATISRVNRSLEDSDGFYDEIYSRIQK